MDTLNPTLHFRDLHRTAQAPTPAELLDMARITYTYNGRGALYQLFNSLPKEQGDTVLVPAFHCTTVIDPILQAGYKILYYEVDVHLRANEADIISKLSTSIAAVVIINFFGFPTELGSIRSECRRHNCLLVEDCSHSFLQNDPVKLTGDRGDAAIYSFWKIVPTHVGGGIRINSPAVLPPPTPNRIPLSNSLVRYKRMTEEAISNLGDNPLHTVYSFIENNRVRLKRVLTSEPGEMERRTVFLHPFDQRTAEMKMPWLSRLVLAAADLNETISRRRENFRLITQVLNQCGPVTPLFPQLPLEVCPWVYPVLLENRATIDYQLRELGVPLCTFGETLHPTLTEHLQPADPARESAEYLSHRLLCLPVHQTLNPAAIEKFCSAINRFIARH